MKKVILIHGWGGYPGEAWQSWLKKELDPKDFEVETPEMPDTETPRIDAWVKKLREIAGEINEDTYLIGHSIGCQTIMRYLETLDENKKVGGCIFVAGFFDLLETAYEEEAEKEIAKPWLEIPINLDKVKKHTNKVIAIFSDNDECVPLSGKEIFKKKLGAEIIVEHKKGHFSSGDKINKLPIVLDKLLEISR